MANPESRYEDGKFLVRITNGMLSQLHVEQRVVHWSDIDATVFVTLFEGVSGEPLRDVIRPMCTKEDEIHNVQVVIDTLSLDILHVSLSHITGEDVVGANKRAIGNLMEVMLGLLEFILEGIGSDVSSRTSESSTMDLVEDPDRLTGEMIDEILQKELSKKCSISDVSRTSAREEPVEGAGGSNRVSPSYKLCDSTTGNSTAELIALGRISCDDSSHLSANNTADLIALGDSRYATRSPIPRGLPAATTAGWADPPPAAGYTSKYKFATAPLPFCHDGKRREAWSALGTSAPSRLQDSDHLATSHPPDESPSKTASSQVDSSVCSASHLAPHTVDGEPPLNSELTNLGMRARGAAAQGALGPGGMAGGAAGGGFGGMDGVMSGGDPGGMAGRVAGRVAGGAAGVLGGLGASASSSFTHHLYHHFDRPAARAGVNLPDFSSSLPLENSQAHVVKRNFTTRIDAVSTMPICTGRPDERRYNSSLPLSERSAELGSRAHSYDNLQNLMTDTVAMSRQAVRMSPLRKQVHAKAPVSPTHTKPHAKSSMDRVEPKVASNKGPGSKQPATHKAMGKAKMARRKVNSPPRDNSAPASPKGICSPGRKPDRVDKASKKVSFKVGRASSLAGKSDEAGVVSTAPSVVKKPASTSGYTSRPRQSNTATRGATWAGPAMYERRAPSRSLFSSEPLEPGRKPETFAEYLDKYYGILDRRDRLVSTETEDAGVSPHTDSAFELSDASPGRADGYSGDADVSEDVEGEGRLKASRLPKQGLSERLEDEDSPYGKMTSIRHKLDVEGKCSRVKTQALAKLYDMELEDFGQEVTDHMKKARLKSREKDREYKKIVLRAPKTSKPKPKRTSVLRPRVRTRSTSAQSRGRKLGGVRGRKRSATASPAVGRRCVKSPVQEADSDLLPWLLDEFPFLHLSKETLHELWRKSSRQVEQLTRAQLEVRRRKSKAQVQIEEAERRHGILKDIMKKELAHNERMKDLKERQTSQQTTRTQLKNRRTQSARARRCYDEFQVRARSKMLKKRNREELIFKRLFKDGLDIHRDRIRDLRQYARENRERRSQREQNELESIENYYRDQFALVNEALIKERKDIEIKDQAQSQVVKQMKRELRQKMEHEIRTFQEQLFRDEDEEYFRQRDADRMREHLQLCRYQASV